MKQLNDIRSWLLQQPSLGTRGERLEKNAGYHVLFAGPSSSDKLATAKMLGEEFGKEVHRIDLSQVVSKYIGETEKNLDAVFKKAAGKNWILFFDEADALFGKRTGIKDAHDRYANTEVNYLLQRAEAYPGLIILAAHLKDKPADALMHRFKTVLQFPES
jgi:SpoVK/Ycf46/Vps4 family AAA+-type ATPase